MTVDVYLSTEKKKKKRRGIISPSISSKSIYLPAPVKFLRALFCRSLFSSASAARHLEQDSSPLMTKELVSTYPLASPRAH